MAKLPTEYKIEKNIPIMRTGGSRKPFDESIPEFVTMMKLKVGDSFEFPRERANFINNARVHLRKQDSPLCFTFPTKATFQKNPKMATGRCWRIKDGSYKPKGEMKVRPKGKDIDLTEHK